MRLSISVGELQTTPIGFGNHLGRDMSDVKIELKNICKSFETSEVVTHALQGVNLVIRAGDYVCISGPSGSGKSTLLSILGLLDEATSGQYLIEGKDVTHLSLDESAEIRNRKIGFVFQSFNLINDISVFDNVALPLQYRPTKLPADEVVERVERCLAAVDITHRKSHKPHQLSGGQQQRVAIARALVSEPAILLVDEPTGNLDSKIGDSIMKMLGELNANGTTICIVSHDMRYAGMAKARFELLDGELKAP